MSKKSRRTSSIKSKSPAMKNWQNKHMKGHNKDSSDSLNDSFSGFLKPAFATFCLFMISGVMTADDDWGIIAAFGMTMVFWPIISLIFILRYSSSFKDDKDGMKGATYSFLASLSLILMVVVFGGLLQS